MKRFNFTMNAFEWLVCWAGATLLGMACFTLVNIIWPSSQAGWGNIGVLFVIPFIFTLSILIDRIFPYGLSGTVSAFLWALVLAVENRESGDSYGHALLIQCLFCLPYGLLFDFIRWSYCRVRRKAEKTQPLNVKTNSRS